MGLSWLEPMYSFPVAEGAQCHDSECIGTNDGNHICNVIQLYIAIDTLCLYCDFSTLLHTLLNKNPIHIQYL